MSVLVGEVVTHVLADDPTNDPAVVEAGTNGGCNLVAARLHRDYDLPVAVVRDEHGHWRHALVALLPQSTGLSETILLDVTGVRTVADIEREWVGRIQVLDTEYDPEHRALVDSWWTFDHHEQWYSLDNLPPLDEVVAGLHHHYVRPLIRQWSGTNDPSDHQENR